MDLYLEASILGTQGSHVAHVVLTLEFDCPFVGRYYGGGLAIFTVSQAKRFFETNSQFFGVEAILEGLVRLS